MDLTHIMIDGTDEAGTYCGSNPPEVGDVAIDVSGSPDDVDALPGTELCDVCRHLFFTLAIWRDGIARSTEHAFSAMKMADAGADLQDRLNEITEPVDILEELDQRFDLAVNEADRHAETILTMELDRLRLESVRDRLAVELRTAKAAATMTFADAKNAEIRAAHVTEALADDAGYQDGKAKARELTETIDALGIKIAHRKALGDLAVREMRYVTARLATIAPDHTQA